MKIVLMTHHFPPKYTAGAEQYAYRVARGLQRQGHAVEVVCIESITQGSLTPVSTTDSYQGLIVHRLHYDIRQAPDPFRWSFRNPELGSWAKSFLSDTRPDIVHINSGYLLGGTVPEAARALGLPTVFTLHDYWYLCPLITLLRSDGRVCAEPVPASRCVWCFLSQKRRYRMLDERLSNQLSDLFVVLNRSGAASRLMQVAPEIERMAERRLYLKQVLEEIDLIISPSRFAIHKVQEYGLQPREIVYLPFGLDKSCLSHASPTPDPARLRIGYLGQFAPHKGVHLLLSAYQKLVRRRNGAELVLHGKISRASHYERQLLRLAQNDRGIRFAGPYRNELVGQVLKDLDVIVVPSLWYENRPTVIVEAYANHTPAVAAHLGGMAELIEHDKNGLLFEPGSVQSFAEQLQRLLDEPDLLPRLRQGIQPVPSIEEETTTLASLYRRLLQTRRP